MSEHWYTKDGKACHTQPTKKGAKNPTRATTITDARKMGLLPSVSSILRMASNPALDRWKQAQVVKACYECQPGAEELLEDYEHHILSKADEIRNDAADLGTRIHAALEAFYRNSDSPIDNDLKDYVFSTVDSVDGLHIKPVEHEQVIVCHRHGYAGTTDMVWTNNQNQTCGILDFKSCKTKEDEPIIEKIDHIAQIAAYHVAYWELGEPRFGNSCVGYNVYISTTQPGRVEIKQYTNEQLRNGWEWFASCLALWRIRNKYDPRQTQSANEND